MEEQRTRGDGKEEGPNETLRNEMRRAAVNQRVTVMRRVKR